MNRINKLKQYIEYEMVGCIIGHDCILVIGLAILELVVFLVISFEELVILLVK